MKRFSFTVLFAVLSFSLLSCAPVIREDLMKSSIRTFSMTDLQKDPEPYEGKLFVFGGIIVNTKVTSDGSLIEALYVPVDSRGYLKDLGTNQVRFLALYPKENGILDPVIYQRERQITLAAGFLGTREGKIDTMEYKFPFFSIKEIYLWAKQKDYYYPPYYYGPYPYFWNYPYWGWGYGGPPWWW
jgi:outer membrane lipoprotein